MSTVAILTILASMEKVIVGVLRIKIDLLDKGLIP
jgi:hypothetical protein